MEGVLPIFLSFAGKARSNVALLEFRFFGFGFVWCLIEFGRGVWFLVLFDFFNNEELSSSMEAV